MIPIYELKEHWPRWTWATMTKHFEKYKKTWQYYIEGHDYPREKVEDKIEFRMDGPFSTNIAKNQYKVEIEINILVISMKDDKDAHKMQRIVGSIFSGFLDNLPVYKLGSGEMDDQSVWGCYQLKGGNREKVVISHFGLVEPATRMLQATVEGHYQMII